MPGNFVRRLTRSLVRLGGLHRDEGGAISILTVATIIGLMMVMGLVINVGRHIDDKIKMQNAADAAAYSGGTVLARGMNSLAFTNHLLCDVFALTAYMREAEAENSRQFVPQILSAWKVAGQILQKAEFDKFRRLGEAIPQKIPMEQDLVDTFSEMSRAIAQLLRPALEYVLRERLIPEFQRNVVQNTPQLAQQVTNEVARRHGQKQPQRAQIGMLWRTRGLPVGYPDERNPLERTLPAIDPTPGNSSSGGNQSSGTPDPHPDPLEGADYNSVYNGGEYLQHAFMQRERWARHYLLQEWIPDRLFLFNPGNQYQSPAKMSNFYRLFETFACGQLTKLLHEEYPSSNLPHQIRYTDPSQGGVEPVMLQSRQHENVQGVREYLDQNFMFVGVAYRKQFRESFAGFFRNPLASDPQAFAQVHLFLPQPRLRFVSGTPGAGGAGQSTSGNAGGGFGIDINVPIPTNVHPGQQPGGGTDTWVRENWPVDWSLWNQNWSVQLVPATTDALGRILQTTPPQGAMTTGQSISVKVPSLGGANPRTLRQINTH